jgi:FkbM family methyltransferase
MDGRKPVTNLAGRVMYFARKYLFHTRLGKSRLAARAYRILFDLAAPDLSEPIVFRGVELYVDPADKDVVPSMVAGYFEEIELSIFERLIKDASVFFDVGANIGAYSIIGCLKSERLVAYAFEPVAENQQLLEKNIAAHDLGDRVLVEPYAASDRRGRTRIYLHASGTHSINNIASDRTREIETVRIDELFAGQEVRPDVIKIDVEGHEAAVISGAWETLTRDMPTLFVEYAPVEHRDTKLLVQRLHSLFTTCFVIDEASGAVAEVELEDLNERRILNLILTANDQHRAEIRKFVTG